MASAKQIAWRKKFAKMAKSGKFKKKKTGGFSPRAISKRILKEKGSGSTYQEMLDFYKNDFKTNSVPELRYKERQIARYERMIKKSS